MTNRRTIVPLAGLVWLMAACAGAPAPAAPSPETAAAADTAAAAGDQLPPEPTPAPVENVKFPAYAERTLSNGARVIVVENHEQPVVSVQLLMPGGSAADPGSETGLASLTASLLDKGTTSMDAKEMAEAIDFIGARFGAGASSDWTSVYLTTLTDFMDRGLSLMSDAVLHPTFPGSELQTEKQRRLSALRLQKSQPQALGQEAFLSHVYGDHPYGRTPSEESIQAIDSAAVSAYHDRYYSPAEALFVVAGDVTPDVAARQLEQAFGSWRGQAPPETERAAPPRQVGRTLVFVHKPGLVQAVIYLGHLLPSATGANWPVLDVANQVLGSGSAQFNAWMMKVLRDEHGYTYGAYSQMAERPGPGFFGMRGEFRNEVADSALSIMVDLAHRLTRGDIPAEDLENAKLYLTGSFPRSIETPQQVAGQVASNRLLGRADDYLEEYRSRVADVTLDDVADVAASDIHPDSALIVVVGDATQVLDKVRPFADSVIVVDPDGNPVDVAALAAEAAASSAVTFDASGLKPAERKYGIQFQGNQVGTIVIHWTPTDSAFAVVSEQSVAGRNVTQETDFDALTFAPIRMSTDAGAVGTFTIDVVDGHATGKGINPRTGPTDVDVAVPEGTALEGQFEVALAVTDFEDVAQFTIRTLTSAGEIQPRTVKVGDKEQVEVPAGTFDTYRLEVEGQQPQTIWVTQAAPHVVVKAQPAGQPVEIVLLSM